MCFLEIFEKNRQFLREPNSLNGLHGRKRYKLSRTWRKWTYLT